MTRFSLWVGNTEFWETEDRLINAVRSETQITPRHCFFLRDHKTNQLFNYGFLDFATKEEAAEVLRALDGKPVSFAPSVNYFLKWGTKQPKEIIQRQQTVTSNQSHKTTPQNTETQNPPSANGYSCYVGNLPLSITNSKLLEVFKRYFPSVMKARIITHNGVSKGYGFVKFESPEEVLEAIKRLNNTLLFGEKPIKVSEGNQNIIKTGADILDSQNTTLFLTDLDPAVVNEGVLRSYFKGYGNVISVKIDPQHLSWATVQMETHSAAESAKNALQGSKFGGSTKVLINWEQKEEKKKKVKNFSMPSFIVQAYTQQEKSDFVSEENVDRIIDLMRDYADQQRFHPLLQVSFFEANKQVSSNISQDEKLFDSFYLQRLPKKRYYFY